MPNTKPNIKLLEGRQSPVHLEAPHATQATQAQLHQMALRIVESNSNCKQGVVYTDLRGMELILENEKANARVKHLIFHKKAELRDPMFECHPSDEAEVMEIAIDFLAKTYDFGTRTLAEALNKSLDVPALMDGDHRYVGGDLNRPPGTYNEFGDCDNDLKWKVWNHKELDILQMGENNRHVAVCLHSMDVRDHRKKENAAGELELDREIIIGTRYGLSADPEVLEPFYKAFSFALDKAFDGKAPKIKIDLEFLGNQVLMDRRKAHELNGRDVQYIQIEFMKYLLAGENLEKIQSAMEAAIKTLEGSLKSKELIVPQMREAFNAEFEAWHERVLAQEWRFNAIYEIGETEENFIRLGAQQRDFLGVEVNDVIEDDKGRTWTVKSQKKALARSYTENDQISISDPEIPELVLVRK